MSVAGRDQEHARSRGTENLIHARSNCKVLPSGWWRVQVYSSLMRNVLCLGSRSKKSKNEHKRATLLCGFKNPSPNKRVLLWTSKLLYFILYKLYLYVLFNYLCHKSVFYSVFNFINKFLQWEVFLMRLVENIYVSIKALYLCIRNIE